MKQRLHNMWGAFWGDFFITIFLIELQNSSSFLVFLKNIHKSSINFVYPADLNTFFVYPRVEILYYMEISSIQKSMGTPILIRRA